MSLQNRVTPFGDLIVSTGRGTFLGNRGGRFHRDDRTLGTRRFASRQWICCVLDFKGRQRDVWGAGYTELFFLDEVTALAAGHRPCFECRRVEAQAFAKAFAKGQGLRSPLRAPDMDRVLHAERLDGRQKRLHRRAIESLPDGAMISFPLRDDPGSEKAAFAVRAGELRRWTPSGYDERIARPQGMMVDVLTPPAILSALANGFYPHWHPSARD